jgi:hypothetical protein
LVNNDEGVVSLPLQRPHVPALVVLAATFLVVLVSLVLLGRVWFCACGTLRFFTWDPATMHNSQHIADWYAPSHLLHGIVFYWILAISFPKLALRWRLVISMIVESIWEVFENSPIVIGRYRDGTAAVGYTGDSITNVAGDLAFCLLGFAVARWVGWKWSIAIFVACELAALVAIRDNLMLNVLMLLYPIDAIRDWQAVTLTK